MTGFVNGRLTIDPMKRDGGASRRMPVIQCEGRSKTCGLKIRKSQSINSCTEKKNNAMEDAVLVNTCYTLATV